MIAESVPMPANTPLPTGHADNGIPAGTTSVDEAEVARFSAMAADWWNPNGKFKPLHRFNPMRLGYLRDRLTAHFRRDPKMAQPLAGLRLLDIGCGGGLLAEPLTRLGATVTGIDASHATIAVARLHAEQRSLTIDYRDSTAEALAAKGERFDAVLAMEIVEHVVDRPAFLATTASLLAPGSILVVATLNRTTKSYAFAIVGAEYVLGWLPRGTHDWRKFVKPEELTAEIAATGLAVGEVIGANYSPLSDRWSLGSDTSVNYMILATQG
jgi:2-polyprenyl-6-hydroxyphenyl methylase/3-demethylubiquinone-9 3-methyltransferase